MLKKDATGQISLRTLDERNPKHRACPLLHTVPFMSRFSAGLMEFHAESLRINCLFIEVAERSIVEKLLFLQREDGLAGHPWGHLEISPLF